MIRLSRHSKFVQKQLSPLSLPWWCEMDWLISGQWKGQWNGQWKHVYTGRKTAKTICLCCYSWMVPGTPRSAGSAFRCSSQRNFQVFDLPCALCELAASTGRFLPFFFICIKNKFLNYFFFFTLHSCILNMINALPKGTFVESLIASSSWVYLYESF